jgi:hypothetical protein
MSEQVPAGWYPDKENIVRYWDGSQWTEHVQPSVPHADQEDPRRKKDGAFSRIRKAREERALDRAQAVRAAGALVTSGVFGTSTIEIYEGGYVRVASGERPDPLGRHRPGRAIAPGQVVPIGKNTPYERLRSIKFTPAAEDNSSGTDSTLEGAVGPTMAKLLHGGKAALKGSVPGLAATGIGYIASVGSRTSFLTIATDKEIHQLTNQGHNGFVKTANKGHVDVGLAIEAAGNAVLGVAPDQAARESSAVASAQPTDSAAAERPSVSERLRELADLHREGILSDDEFAEAKAKVLGDL